MVASDACHQRTCSFRRESWLCPGLLARNSLTARPMSKFDQSSGASGFTPASLRTITRRGCRSGPLPRLGGAASSCSSPSLMTCISPPSLPSITGPSSSIGSAWGSPFSSCGGGGCQSGIRPPDLRLAIAGPEEGFGLTTSAPPPDDAAPVEAASRSASLTASSPSAPSSTPSRVAGIVAVGWDSGLR